MTWILFAVLCAIFLSFATLLEKHLLMRIRSVDLASAIALANAGLSLPFAFFVKWNQVSLSVIGLMFCTALLAATAFFLVAKAARHSEISSIAPLLSLSPGTTALLGFLFLGEHLSVSALFGILLMIIGSYVLTMEREKGFFEPLRAFARSRYLQFALLSLLFYSLGAIFDRAILSEFEVSVPTYMSILHIFMALLFLPVVLVFGGGLRGIGGAFRTGGLTLILASLTTVIYRFFQMEALSLAYVGLVSAIKRSSSFFTTLIGGELFHEHGVKRKVFACLIILFGVLCIIA